MGRPPIKRVSRDELRRAFNQLYLADIRAGRLPYVIESEGTPDPRMNQPPGTLSQRLRYFDKAGRSVAVIHRYLLPDGTLGGSGMPDPKAVLVDGVIQAAPVPERPPPPRPPRKRNKQRPKKKR